MTIRKIGFAVVVALLLSALSASWAHAEAGQWNVAGEALSGAASVATEKSGSTALELSVPELGIKLTAAGAECVECTIENDGTAHSAGKLRFTGVTVSEPEGCAVASTLTTNSLEDEVITSGEQVYDKFTPASGETLITVKLSECAFAGKYKLVGTLAGRSPGATGEEWVNQQLTFNGSTAGAELTFGGKPAVVMGETSSHLTGAYEGEAFSASVTVPVPGHWNLAFSELSGAASVATEKSGSTALELSVPEFGIKLTAAGVECVECTIENDGTAHVAGRLRFTGVTVNEPEGCAVSSELTTNALKGEMAMYEGSSYLRTRPVEGGTVVQVKLSECAFAGKYNLTGTFAGLSPTTTGEEWVNRTLTFNGNTAGAELKLGGKPATMMGEVSNHLTGTNAGKSFSASLSPPSKAGEWTFNGSPLSGPKEVVAEKSGSTALELSVPEFGIKLTAAGVECVECTIYNDGTAHGLGKLKFTGVTINEPEGCTVASTLQTLAVTSEVIMFEGSAYDVIFPQTGETFITVKLSECAFAGKYSLTGTLAGTLTNGTGVEAATQVLAFNGSSAAGTALDFGGKPAFVMGEVANTLVGGGVFGAHN
jgi:hypothetical protein